MEHLQPTRRRAIVRLRTEQARERASQLRLAPKSGTEAPQLHPKPGSCDACGRHIGRGIAFHRLRCKGITNG